MKPRSHTVTLTLQGCRWRGWHCADNKMLHFKELWDLYSVGLRHKVGQVPLIPGTAFVLSRAKY